MNTHCFHNSFQPQSFFLPKRLVYAQPADAQRDDEGENILEQLKQRQLKTEKVHHIEEAKEKQKQTLQVLLDTALEKGDLKRANTLLQQIERFDSQLPQKREEEQETEEQKKAAKDFAAVSETHERVAIKEVSNIGQKLKATAESIKKSGEADTQHASKITASLEALSQQDEKNHAQLKSLLKRLQEEGKLNDKEARQIYLYPLGSKIDKSYKNFVKLLKEKKSFSEKDLSMVLFVKEEEETIDRQAYEYMEQSRDLIERNAVGVEKEAGFQMELERLRRATGIDVRKGTILEYDMIEYDESNEILNHIRKEEIIDVRRKKKGEAGKENEIFIILKDGSVFTGEQFAKWVFAQDVTEKIPTKNHLQKKIESYFEGVAFDLKVGTKLETQELERKNSELIVTPTVVTIQEISDGYIKLDHRVTVRPASFTHGLGKDEKKQHLTHGEFLRWLILNQALPHFDSLDQLRFALKRHNAFLNKHYKRDEKEYPPITVNLKGKETLYYNDGTGRRVEIEKVNQNTGEVKLSNGLLMTPTAFLAWVRDFGVEKKTPEAEEHKAKKIAPTLYIDTEINKDGKNGDKDKTEKDKQEKEKQSPEEETPKHPPIGMVQKIWRETRFLSIMDVIRMAQTIYDFLKRKELRKSKDRFSSIGKLLPGSIGTEFLRVNQGAQNEEVGQYKEAFAQLGTDEVLDILHKTHSNDETKACFNELATRGQIRWDDKEMWATLNRVAGGEPKWVDKEDDCEDVINGLWGKDQYRQWYNQNDGAYRTSRDQYKELAKKVEADPKGTGGLRAELQNMLLKWKKGNYVDPTKYEAMIYYAIEAGKLVFNEKLYYIIMGVGYKNPHGKTLLHIDRVSNLDSDLLARFPVLDFFTNKEKRDSKPEGGAWRVSDYETWVQEYCDLERLDDPEKYTLAPGSNFDSFVNNTIFMDRAFRIRLVKASNTATWDHDDMHVHGAFLNEQNIDNLTNTGGTGNQSRITKEGFKNVYAGLNDQIRRQVEGLISSDPKEQGKYDMRMRSLVDFLRTFLRFDGIMSNRMYHTDTSRIRITSRDLKDPCVVDSSRPIGSHVEEMKNFLKTLINGLNNPALVEKYKLAYQTPKSKFDSKGSTEQESAFQSLGRDLEIAMQNFISSEGGRARFDSLIIEAGKGLKGIPEVSKLTNEDLARFERAKEAAYELEKPDIKSQQEILREYDRVLGQRRTQPEADAAREAHLQDILRRLRTNNARESDFLPISEEELKLVTAKIDEEKRLRHLNL